MRVPKQAVIWSLAFVSIQSLTNFSLASDLKISNCQIKFRTKGSPVLISIEGVSENQCQGAITSDQGGLKNAKITMDLTKLDTGIPLRNKHLRENYLHTDKYPTTTLSEIEATDYDNQLAKKGKAKTPFKAMLEIHGSKKAITGTYEIAPGNIFSSEFDIDLPEFGIDRPTFMGVKVVDKVYVSVKFKAE